MNATEKALALASEYAKQCAKQLEQAYHGDAFRDNPAMPELLKRLMTRSVGLENDVVAAERKYHSTQYYTEADYKESAEEAVLITARTVSSEKPMTLHVVENQSNEKKWILKYELNGVMQPWG